MKKRKLIGIVAILILVLSIGYAILSANLNINGAFNFQEASWDVYLDNIQVTDGSVEADLPVISDKTTISFEGELSKPGDFYEFSVDVVNAGTIDAVISNVENTALTEEQSKYINYTARYYGTNNTVSSNYIIPAEYKERIVVRIEYKYDIEDFISFDNLSLSLSLMLSQPNPSEKYNNIVYNFFMINDEAVFTVPKTGNYLLETWGAQGGSVNSELYGGYGGYSSGQISLQSNQIMYVNVGGKGSCSSVLEGVSNGGYNGGGTSQTISSLYTMCSGGGATHIAFVSGILSTLKDNKSSILIVSGGGGSSGTLTRTNKLPNSVIGGHAGGLIGSNPIYTNEICTDCGDRQGGSQTSGGAGRSGNSSFGQGGSISERFAHASGGGGGYYGGGSDTHEWGGSGGSSYIANTLLTKKSMYCFNCIESNEESTKTISTTNVSSEPFSQYAKIGNGFVRITYIG